MDTHPVTLQIDPLLDIKQAAKILGISHKTLRDHVLHRRITYVKVRGRLLFRPETLMDYIEANTVPAVVECIRSDSGKKEE